MELINAGNCMKALHCRKVIESKYSVTKHNHTKNIQNHDDKFKDKPLAPQYG